MTIESKKEGEPSFVVTPFKGDKKERTEEAINTWLGRWESHCELHPKPDAVKIGYISLVGLVRLRTCGQVHYAISLSPVIRLCSRLVLD